MPPPLIGAFPQALRAAGTAEVSRSGFQRFALENQTGGAVPYGAAHLRRYLALLADVPVTNTFARITTAIHPAISFRLDFGHSKGFDFARNLSIYSADDALAKQPNTCGLL